MKGAKHGDHLSEGYPKRDQRGLKTQITLKVEDTGGRNLSIYRALMCFRLTPDYVSGLSGWVPVGPGVLPHLLEYWINPDRGGIR